MADDRHEPTKIHGEAASQVPPTLAREHVDENADGIDLANDLEFTLSEPVSITSRYEVVRSLGQGGFGAVVLANDKTLERQVAIKLPRKDRVSTSREVEMFLNEARALAQLDHPNILPVYDFGRTDDGRCFAVSKFVEGFTFDEMMKSNDLPTSVDALTKVLNALATAHEQGIVHRDVKPQNIFVDKMGTPYLGDFGLALTASHTETMRQVGTLQYMSPEQCRGESHLVDGRADIFSAGVILYRILTGAFPFEGDTPSQVYERIVLGTPKPPRQFKRSVPRELERICLKALASRASDRYTTAFDFADELSQWQNAIRTRQAGETDGNSTSFVADESMTGSTLSVTRVVPRGLRSFGERDADFFLRLLPGPRAASGLPDIVEHWKQWVESRDDGEPASRVGVIYGPSGCGKSSLLRAGVFPNLDASTTVIFAEATREGTEDSLRESFSRILSTADEEASLAELGSRIRRGQGVVAPDSSVVIVVDQLEQWLAGHRVFEAADFAALLRQCDGQRLKAVLLVRDDFWVPLSRLLSFVEVPFETGRNAVFIDLFDKPHARNVLHEFGYAYGRLPSPKADISADQQLFLSEAVENLSTDGSVFPVRIAVFAEMVKARDWSLATLKDFGGAEGVGVRFLEETFESETTPVRFRRFASSAATVLGSLLPAGKTAKIRGAAPTFAELRTQTGFDDEPTEFAELIQILDKELRLISVSRDIIQAGSAESQSSEFSRVDDEAKYHLSHEYLIPSIREWLRRRNRSSRAGRARLQYEDALADWQVRRSARSLPGLFNWIMIRCFVSRSSMNDSGRAMMQAADRHHALRLVGACVVFGVVGGLYFRNKNQNAAESLVRQIETASISSLPSVVAKANDQRAEISRRLRARQASDGSDQKKDLNSLAALYALAGMKEGLLPAILAADPAERRTVAEQLIRPGDADLVGDAEEILVDRSRSASNRLAAAHFIAVVSPESESLHAEIQQNRDLSDELIRHQMASGEFIDDWVTAFDPVAESMISHLAKYAFAEVREAEGVEATKLVLRWCRQRPERVVDSLLDLPRWQDTETVYSVIRSSVPRNVERLKELASTSIDQLNVVEREAVVDDAVLRRAGFAVALLAEQGHSELVNAALMIRPNPVLRAEVIYRLCHSTVENATIQRWIESASLSQNSDVVAAGLMVLSTREKPAVPMTNIVKRFYREAEESIVQSSAELCLANWNMLGGVDLPAAASQRSESRQWRLNTLGHKLISVPTRPIAGEPLYPPDSPLHDYGFEVMATEVTVADFLRFFPDNYINEDISQTRDAPANVVTFSEAVGFARWLTTKDGFSEDDQCYPPIEFDDTNEMRLPVDWKPYADHRQRAGYRLPTAEEWTYMARGATGGQSTYLTGETTRRLSEYVWSRENSDIRAHPIVSKFPNSIGVFNMFGNVAEWTITAASGNQRLIERSSYDQNSVSMRFTELEFSSTSEDTQWNQLGMRLVRSVPPEENTD